MGSRTRRVGRKSLPSESVTPTEGVKAGVATEEGFFAEVAAL